MLPAGEAPEACQTHSKSGLSTHADETAGLRSDSGATGAVLLNTTAETYFERRGHQRLDRAQAPTSFLATREF